MGRLKKTIEPVVIEPVVEAPKLRTVKLQGGRGSSMVVGINGVQSELPCGIDIEVSDELYCIVEPYIV